MEIVKDSLDKAQSYYLGRGGDNLLTRIDIATLQGLAEKLAQESENGVKTGNEPWETLSDTQNTTSRSFTENFDKLYELHEIFSKPSKDPSRPPGRLLSCLRKGVSLLGVEISSQLSQKEVRNQKHGEILSLLDETDKSYRDLQTALTSQQSSHVRQVNTEATSNGHDGESTRADNEKSPI